ncbi:MAG TPA: TetR/AcrR family transcriptional regulator [Thermoleophilaceae bacterium]|jgi:AcrR family transcriptional regulator
MPTGASQRRTYLEAEERRAQILRVAARLFSERNYEAVSTAEVAKEAGIARGLVNHYFRTKRELYVEVVRSMLEVPDDLFPVAAGADESERLAVLSDAVDRWLRTVKANRRTWLACIGAQGFGRDPELEAVLEAQRRKIIDQLIALAWGPPADAPPQVRAVMRGYEGFAQAITADWLRTNRPTRREVHELLVQGLVALVDEVLPKLTTQTTGATT